MRTPPLRLVLAATALVVGLVCEVSLNSAAGAGQRAPWEDRTLTPDRRAQLLVAAMTLEEKSALLYGYGTKEVAGERWQVYVKGNLRLGIPDMTQGDTASGLLIGSDAVTQMPAPIALAATWSVADARSYGEVMGSEARALGYGVLHGPNLDVVRDPRHGRAYDTFGEDPYLAGRIASEYVRGVQAHRVIADAKHFIVNSVERDRRIVDVQVDKRTLHEIYLFPFLEVVRSADVGMVMCAYNKVNGVYACDSGDLLTGLLRDRWGFRGIVRTDAGAAHGLQSIVEGVDQEFRSELHFGKELIAAVKSGSLAEAVVDRAVMNVLRTMITHGIFDDPPARTSVDLPTDSVRAQHLAESAVVLLRNQNALLPLSASRVRRIAIIGPHANDTRTAGGPAHTAPLGKDTVVQAIQRRVPDALVEYAPGVDPISPIAELPGYAPLPSSILKAADGSSGATATYSGMDRRPLISRVDGCVCFSTANNFVDSVAVRPSVPSAVAFVTWTASLLVSRAGSYGFDATSPDAVELYVDGKLLLQIAASNELRRKDARVTLSAGKHDIRVEYVLGAGTTQQETTAGPSHLLKVGWLAPAGVFEPKIREAAALAARADVAIVVVRDLASETLDRAGLTLPNDQNRLIEAVAQANPRTVVALTTGSAVVMPWASRVPAILEAWYGGTAGGAALVRTLFGDVDPAGRLPISFPARVDDLPTSSEVQFPGVGGVARFSEGVRVGYRHFNSAQGPRAAYPFGFGLSYTSFRYSDLSISAPNLVETDADWDEASEKRPSVMLNFTVTNRGRRTGVTVPQIYIEFPRAATEPAPLLKAFEKIQLAAGESRRLSIAVRQQAFAVYVSSEDRWKVLPGTYRLRVGESSTAFSLSAAVTTIRTRPSDQQLGAGKPR